MFRLLVVDDEQDITEGLYEMFRDFEMCELDVYKAYSGFEALEWIHRTKIDIVLTDIRMPGFTGLQLMESIRAQWPKCRIIFLTGHNEFEYVYTAIKNEGVRYLLKMEGHEAIIKEVEDAVQQLVKEQELNDLLAKANQSSDKGLTPIKEQYVLEWLNGNLPVTEDMDRQFSALGIPIDMAKPILPIACKVEMNEPAATYAEKLQCIHSIQLVFQKYMSATANSICVEYEPMNLLWLAQPAGDKEQVWAKPDQLMLFVQEYLETIHEVCQTSLHAELSFIADTVYSNGVALPEWFQRMKSSGSSFMGEDRSTAAIAKVLAYIDDHIGEDLSLVKLAEEVGINHPSYLSRLFKRVTGNNLLSYINDKRMDLAKAWLAEDRYKIYEIAERLGFATAPYFTRFFKKKMKISPQEYRESQR